MICTASWSRRTAASDAHGYGRKLLARFPGRLPHAESACGVRRTGVDRPPPSLGFSRQRSFQLPDLATRLIGQSEGLTHAQLRSLSRASVPTVLAWLRPQLAEIAAVDTNVARVICRV